MGTPHKHAEVIKAWADGGEIEVKSHGIWLPVVDPFWVPSCEYRIKPVPHKWQHLIDAQKAGKACQMSRGDGTWSDGHFDFDSKNREYRLKPLPVVVKTKRFWWKSNFGDTHLLMVNEREEQLESRQSWKGFISWVDTEWQEHEVPA